MDRSRTDPKVGFAHEEIELCLDSAKSQLLGEVPRTGGLRQITLYKHGHVTLALIYFDAGSSMPRHKANGEVFLHVLEGTLRVTGEAGEHVLEAGNILILQPNVEHDLRAEQPALMLLTVTMEKSALDAPTVP